MADNGFLEEMAAIVPGSSRPTINAGEYVYIMQDGTINASTSYDNALMYTAHTVGTAVRNMYTNDVNVIRESLDFIKDRGTVFQDRYEAASDPTYVAPDMATFNQFTLVDDPIDERTMMPQVSSVWQEDPTPTPTQAEQEFIQLNMAPYQQGVRPPDTGPIEFPDRPLGTLITRRPTTHTQENNELAAAVSLIKAQEEGIVQRIKVQSRKDKSGQYQVCYGCISNVDSVFPGKPSLHGDRCAQCARRTGRTHNKDFYMTKDTKDIMYQLFAEEVVPVIKKQALFEAKQRISEAEEKDNKVKRTMVRIAKKRA